MNVSSGVFISPLILQLFFECFHFTNFLCRDFFLSGTLFLLAVVASATDLREPFLNSGVFYLTLLPDFGTTYFYQSLPGPAVLLRRLQGLPLKFETLSRPIFLFEPHSVQQKVLVGRFYLCIRSCYRLLY